MTSGKRPRIYATPEKIKLINPDNKSHIRRYFAFKGTNLSADTKKGYESDFNQWLVFIMENYENKDLLEFETEDATDMLEDFMAHCVTVFGNNERRIQRRLSSISSFYLFLRKKRKIKENPVEFLERPSVKVGEKPQIKQTFLTKQQVKLIRKELKASNNLQLELLFEFGITTLARVKAISNVKIEQINFKENRIERVLEKEGYIVNLFPSKRTMELIKQWLDYRKKEKIESEYLFITKYKGEYKQVDKATIQSSWMKKIGEIIGEPAFHAHDLRHSGADLYHKSGMSLEDVSQLLNHKSTQVTKDHYLQVNYENLVNVKTSLEF